MTETEAIEEKIAFYDFDTHINVCLDCSARIAWRELIPFKSRDRPIIVPAQSKRRYKRCAECAAALWEKQQRTKSYPK